MLPSPALARYHRKPLRLITTGGSRHNRLESLSRRSRITNLGVFLLAGCLAISLILNLRYWAFHPSLDPNIQQRAKLQFATVERPSKRNNLNNLIVVPCHAIWRGSDSWLEDKDWILESYQQGAGRVRAFYEHIARSAELANKDPHSLLIFSGGQTKPLSSTTEAESYLRLAQAARLLPDQLLFERSTTENYALDSFQNLLFSIARFHEFTGHFPSTITVVGYEFKRPRFTKLHREALRWPSDKFNYVGVDPEDGHRSDAVHGEQQNGYLPYTHDKYGCHSMLLTKRRQRNPHSRFHPYHISSPELVPLLEWCPDGGSALFNGYVPWGGLVDSR
ncbi:hypothetical protein BYT27DRAFT_6352731 [Phlegmacium glaucopus]|nr:hypothetical protein BYT27DRAFT_6352731 [Phlegmacium glaucopus]